MLARVSRGRAWATSSIVALLGCASGGNQSSTTAASLGDADGTATTSNDTTTTATDETTSGIGMTSAVDSTSDDPIPTSDSTDAIPSNCEEDPAACTAWLLPNGSGQWIPLALDTDSTLAPTDTVRAAFDIEGELEGFVLTDTRLHVVDLPARQWVRREDRASVLPELGNAEILVAYTIPAGWSGGDPNTEGVTFLSATTAYIYDYTIDTGTFSFIDQITRFGAAWDAAAAPDPAQLRAAWLDVTNDPGWYEADIMALCGVAGEPGPYVAFIAGSNVHLSDAGYCFEFVEPVTMPAFSPFTLPNAPVAADVGGALYNETMGLWVLRGT